jgi:hypothetical protein
MKRTLFIKRLKSAQAKARAAIASHDGSKYARGLSNEGFDGGYLQALYDVEAMLTHGTPGERKREFWDPNPGK